MSKYNICVDFDGVLNNYQGWNGSDELYTIRDGAKEFMEKLNENYNIIVFTVRDNEKVQKWLEEYNVPFKEVTSIKVGAVCYIDDRGLKFNGDYDETLNQINDFKTYWE